MDGRWLEVTVSCSRCDQKISGTLQFDARNTLVDLQGFMVFDEGAVCDRCLDEKP